MISGMVATVDDWIGAERMYAEASSPAAAGVVTTSGEAIEVKTWDFDQTTREGVWFVAPVKGKTVAVDFHWTCTAGTGGVYWTCSGNAAGVDSTLDTAADTSAAADTRIADEIMHVAFGSRFQVLPTGPRGLFTANISRLPTNGADTLTADARLIGVMLRWL